MSSKIEKTIARQKEKIAEGQYYEAQQQLRVIASRYVKQSKYDDAADILSRGAIALLQAGQGGSGGDLALMLMAEVYSKAEWPVDEGNKKRLVEILRAFPPEEPTKKRFVQEIIGWSGRLGELERGDPELHHVAGSLYAQENEPYDAERHLIFGTSSSPETLANLEYNWYTNDDSHTAPIYASRAIFPYLLSGNLRSANKAFLIFTSKLSSSSSPPFSQQVSSTHCDSRVYPALPLLNFIGLLLLACQRGSSDLFRQLGKHYAVHIKEVGIWEEALANIGEVYFGIKIPRAMGNPLFDMMGSMFFKGGDSGKASPRPGTPKPEKQQAKTAAKNVEPAPAVAAAPAPPTMDLD